VLNNKLGLSKPGPLISVHVHIPGIMAIVHVRSLLQMQLAGYFTSLHLPETL
jgi:hypothetical protein